MTDPTEGTRTPEAALAEALARTRRIWPALADHKFESWAGEILAALHPDVRLINVTEQVSPTVAELRAILRELRSIDWTMPDDLTRYATEVHDALEKL